MYKDDQKYALSLLKQIYDWLNAQTRELAKLQATEKIELSGLEGILPDVTKEEMPLKEINQQALNEQIKLIALKQVSSKPQEVKSNAKRKKNPLLKDEPKKKPERKDKDKEPSEKPNAKVRKANLSNIRSFCIDEKMGIYRFVVTAKGKGELTFYINIAGEDGSKTALAIDRVKNVNSVEDVKYNENAVGPIPVEDKEKLVFDVTFKENSRYSFEVTV